MEETPETPLPARALPGWGTSFVERGAELHRLEELLGRPECRLVTILGPGGVGKTRLAAEFARSLPAGTAWLFVELERYGDLDVALVQGLGLPAERTGDAVARVASSIADAEQLLLLDNAEHLVDQAAVMDELLGRCPRLKAVVTSRHTLGIAAEWLLPLDGLACSDAIEGEPAALRLFATRFELASGRALERNERESAIEICERLAGVPLAIELAAAWGSTLSVAEIRDELERDPGGLESNARAVPGRHRSVRAVFEHTWQLLSPRERAHFAALSVFTGGFDRNAALEVANVDLAGLSALVGKSLVRADSIGRFAVHPLVHEFARERLHGDPERHIELLARHAVYFRSYVLQTYPDVSGHHQLRAVRHLEPEWANVKAAWAQSMANGDFNEAAECLYLLCLVSFFRARYDDAHSLAAQAMAAAGGKHYRALRYVALTYLGWLHVRWGELDSAEQYAVEALQLQAAMPEPGPPLSHLDAALPLATARLAQGDYAAAAELARATVERARRTGSPSLEALALYTLENALWEMADFEDASVALDAAAALCLRNGDSWLLAHVQLDLARRAVRNGDLAEAESQLAASIEIRDEFGDAGGLAASRFRLGEVLLLRGDRDGAERQFLESIQLFRKSGDPGGIATAESALGRIALSRGDDVGARARFLHALEVARDIGYAHLAADVLVDVAEMSHRGGDAGALPILAFVAEHSATPSNVLRRVHAVAEQISPETWNDARRKARSLTRVTVVSAAIAALRAPRRATTADPGNDALTARELEVLRLVASGASNGGIAEALGVKLGTAKWYTSQLYARLGVANRTEAVARARERGLLP